MSITEILNNTEGHAVSVSIGLKDLREWHNELVNEKINQAEQAAAEKADQNLFTPVEVCGLLKCSRSTLTRWQSKGYLVPIKVGGKAMYRRSDLERILNQKGK